MDRDFLTVGKVDGRWAILLIRSWTWPAIQSYHDSEEAAREALQTARPPVWVGR